MEFITDNLIISCSRDQTLRAWSIWDPAVAPPIHKAEAPLNCMALTPDKKTLVIGCADGSILFWDVPGNKLLLRKQVQERPISCLACSACGLMVAAAGIASREIVLLDRVTREKLFTLIGAKLPPKNVDFDVRSMSFSPNSTRLVLCQTSNLG